MKLSLEKRDGHRTVAELTRGEVNAVAARMLGVEWDAEPMLESWHPISRKNHKLDKLCQQWNAYGLCPFTASLDAAAEFERECLPKGYYLSITAYGGKASHQVVLSVRGERLRVFIVGSCINDRMSEAENRARAVIAACVHSRGGELEVRK